MADRPPVTLRAYAAAASALAPLIRARVRGKLTREGVAGDRLAERDGRASRARPPGRLVWFHAASLGESLSLLPLIARLTEAEGGLSVLVTTGTASSAEAMAARLPPRAIHQFAPIDTGGAVTRFLDHWRPDLLVLAESEIWPTTLTLARARGLPTALIGARLSPRSLRNWGRAPATARHLLAGFDLVSAQDATTREGLLRLGARETALREDGNLKEGADPPAADGAALAALRGAVGDRPVWLAASTHEGEEEAVLDAHCALLAHDPRLLLILAPRHPARAGKLREIAGGRGLSHLSRGTGALPGPDTQVYIADTLGEMGLFYRLAPMAFLGGSLAPAGGHNPWEAAALGTAILHGPGVRNAEAAYAALARVGAARAISDKTALAEAALALLADPEGRAEMGEAARAAAETARSRPDGPAARLADDLLALLPAEPGRPRLVTG